MNFLKFRIQNFKGIEDTTLNLNKVPSANIFTLIGLNESGKTTVLEALNFWSYSQESKDTIECLGFQTIQLQIYLYNTQSILNKSKVVRNHIYR